MILFNKAIFIDDSLKHIEEVLLSRKICGDGAFTKKCSNWIEENFGVKKVLLTTSCTHALEMAALLLNIKAEDEIIAPSYTFVSTVNAFVLRGAKIKFVDIRADTMNIDENLIEEAITCKTRAIVVVHYAGVACEMDKILAIAKKYNLPVIEDAAQGVMSTYKGRYLGTIGELAAYSFHETKNFTMGEGGALLINDRKYLERAEIIREKGTNRNQFFRGEVDKYTWCNIGSSYLPSEINAAYLWAQLEMATVITQNRLNTWNSYHQAFNDLSAAGDMHLPYVPGECIHNGHMYYIKCHDLATRAKLIEYLRANNVYAVFHYVPLHSAEAGLKYGEFIGDDKYTTRESEKLVRLPLYYNLEKNDLEQVIASVRRFFGK